ncbi:G-protein coupled receptor Mth2-like isoform X1 [Anthonomus grandis grandis]|uniref:G-protein coupled receptor Mth2-like isoform X1 n=1 Tax=Anthonomus grandis grandis TaxID=2921223 RepID=UPI0021661BE5|nr:G-protein coupled receptor Mth2-like isoform X1 [Anthonomus grandis grandis]
MRFLLTLLLLTGAILHTTLSEKCDLTVDLSNGVREGTNIVLNGVTYTANDHFTNSTGTYGCVCNVQSCTQDCCDVGQTLQVSALGVLQCVSAERSTAASVRSAQLHNIIRVPNRTLVCYAHQERVVLNGTENGLVQEENGFIKVDLEDYDYKSFCVFTRGNDVFLEICMEVADRISIVHSIAMGISMPFLVVTFIVYALLPDKNLYQYALMIYVLILFAAYLQLVITNLNEFESGTVGCTFLGYSTYFAFISSFFWLNIICLDIWFTFSRGSHHRGTTSQLKKLGLYSIYGLGAPVLLVVLVYLLQFHFLDTSSKHNPSIGTEKCFFRQDWGNLWYLYLEATILFVANLVLFSWTALSIRKVKKETSTVIKRKHSEPDEQLYHVFMRLALAMGINWSTEIISFFGNWFSKYQYENIWIVTDCLNGLYGVFLFFIFVFKMKTWTLLKKRYYRITGKQPTLGSTVSSRPTNNSTTDSSLINTERSRASRANNSRPEETPLRGHV